MVKQKAAAPTHEVTHPSLYLRGGDGKLQEVAVGTKLALTAKQAKRMTSKGFVRDLKDAETIDVSDADINAAKVEIQAGRETITDLQGKLIEAVNELKGVKEENTDLTAKLTEANIELGKLRK